MGRLKTGTPPRILRSSIDFSKLTYQEPDEQGYLYEFYPHESKSTMPCYIAHTNEQTHEIIRQNRHLSAMFSGAITGRGPRYCPSIEDKITRFPDKTSHHVFVEPESAQSEEIYPNGISTSLPFEVQQAYVRSMEGFETPISRDLPMQLNMIMRHQRNWIIPLRLRQRQVSFLQAKLMVQQVTKKPPAKELLPASMPILSMRQRTIYLGSY